MRNFYYFYNCKISDNKIKKKAKIINLIFIVSLITIIFFLKLVSASNVGLIENSTWGYNLTGVWYSAVAFGDIDNDGDLDLVLTGCSAGECTANEAKIYLNNGITLTESSQWQSNLTGVFYSAVAFGDINNDGNLDLAISGCSVGGALSSCTTFETTRIYINNGTTLTESSQWQNNLTATAVGSIEFGDIDNDGDLDLALSGNTVSGTRIAKMYINNGTTLTESSQWQSNLSGVYESDTAFADVDNDGDLDLALTGDKTVSDKITAIYINNGTTLTEDFTWSQNLKAVDRSSLIFGDYDNDGDLDLNLIGQFSGDWQIIYKNNGTTFIENQTNTNDSLIGLFRGSTAFGDYDNDGDLDLASAGKEPGYARVYENNETNNYYFIDDTLAHSNISNSWTKGSLAWADLDNDTDLDLIITGIDDTLKSRIYINNNTISNTQPTPSTSLNATYTNNILTLTWNNGSDAETNSTGLYYNLMIGNSTTNHTIVSGIYGGSGGGSGGGGGASGYFGNMMQRKSINLNVNLSNGTYYWYVQTIDTGLAKSNWSAVQSFTVGTDATAPNISSISSSVTASTATITWTTDESSNSTVYYGTTTATTSSSSSSSLTTSHSISLSSLSASTLYYYNVSSCDYWKNCNTSGQYNFTTSAGDSTPPPTGGGGGGGSSTTNPVITTPKEFDIDFSISSVGSFESQQGDIKTFTFNSQTFHEIVISEIAENSVKLIIKSEPIILLINLGETKQIDINTDGINDIEIKLVSITNSVANLLFKKLEGADIVAKEEIDEAIRKEALFDVKVSVLDKFKEVFAGEEVTAEIEVLNINNIGQVDVVVDYYLSNNKTVLASSFDTLAVEAVASFVRSLIVPEDVKSGTYFFNVDITYKNFTTSGNTEFKVKSKTKGFIEERFREIVIGAIILIGSGLIIYLRIIKGKEKKLEKEVKKLKGKSWKIWRRNKALF